MRGVCLAEYSQHVSMDKSDTQEWSAVQSIPINTSIDRLGRNVRHLLDERIRTGFTFKVKRYCYVAPRSFHRTTGLDKLYMSIPINHVKPVQSTVRETPLKRIT